MADIMKAAVYTKYGSPDVLQILNVERPNPADNQVLIHVKASTVNRTDCAMLKANPFIMRFSTGFFKPRNPILGTEFAGKIEAVGRDVKSFKIGDRVFGFDDSGLSAHAQYLCLSEGQAFTTIPDNIKYKQAAASSEGAHYAINFINKVNFDRPRNVLVNGATGGIGSAAVQLLKHYGANVTAVCKAENGELVKSLGANKIIDYTKEDFTKINETFHFVFDTVGKSSFMKCKPLLKPGGIYISSELGWMSQNIFYALITPLLSKLPGLKSSRKVIFPLPLNIKTSLLFIKKLIEQGQFKAVIDRTYPLDQVDDAFSYVLKGQKIGNVVLTMD